VYTSIYLYRLLRENAEAFLQVQRDAADIYRQIYRQCGALKEETFAPFDLNAKYGCLAFTDVLELTEGEVLFVGLSRFRDKAHHDEVMAKVDRDARIEQLFEQVTGLLEMSRLVRGEFERRA
jgi:uncharacterized protein YbaA (DUF1428 family)